jgi:hypothetical protein
MAVGIIPIWIETQVSGSRLDIRGVFVMIVPVKPIQHRFDKRCSRREHPAHLEPSA